jgi:hypothetical protein
MVDLAPGVTPSEARRVWDAQDRPSARSVARALTQSGRPVHFTTIARWKREGWRSVPVREHPLGLAMRAVDFAAPVLTGEPMTRAEGLVRDSHEISDLVHLSQAERLNRSIDESCRAAIALSKQMCVDANRLVQDNPGGAGNLLVAIGKLINIAIDARNELDVIRSRAEKSAQGI